ncbi:hypothetical protein EST38_g14278 [Candolleomyces aberdarensis]|uniref:F-box domain-containing protein n=1 Tax=Candolleomyces aberdarensis TaxID=2316362 RepID=A0A4Q2CXP4_9AGAR|nr:hypothetical protein EST38_g14278 [Candolleomyces aberdarensis]
MSTGKPTMHAAKLFSRSKRSRYPRATPTHATTTNISAPELPGSDVPADVLRHIFAEVLSSYDSSPSLDESLQQIIRLSHVCSSWRDAALGDGRLWEPFVRLPDPIQARFDAVFERSSQTPIASISGKLNSTTPQLATLLSQLHRIRHFEITFPRTCCGDEVQCLADALTRPAPLLELLEIEMLGGPAPFATIDPAEYKFGERFSSLKFIRLVGCVWTPASSFDNLVILHLTYGIGIGASTGASDGRIDPMYIMKWWEMCCSGRLPRLEEFILEGIRFGASYPTVRCNPISPGDSMPLTMSLVRLEGDFDAVAWLLDCDELVLPLFCELHLRLAFPSPGRIPRVRAQTGENALEVSKHPEVVLDRVLSRIWQRDISPCRNLTIMLGARMLNHQSAIRIISVEGLPGTSKAAFFQLLQQCILGFSADSGQAHRKMNIISMGPSKTYIVKDFDIRWLP